MYIQTQVKAEQTKREIKSSPCSGNLQRDFQKIWGDENSKSENVGQEGRREQNWIYTPGVEGSCQSVQQGRSENDLKASSLFQALRKEYVWMQGSN